MVLLARNILQRFVILCALQVVFLLEGMRLQNVGKGFVLILILGYALRALDFLVRMREVVGLRILRLNAIGDAV